MFWQSKTLSVSHFQVYFTSCFHCYFMCVSTFHTSAGSISFFMFPSKRLTELETQRVHHRFTPEITLFSPFLGSLLVIELVWLSFKLKRSFHACERHLSVNPHLRLLYLAGPVGSSRICVTERSRPSATQTGSTIPGTATRRRPAWLWDPRRRTASSPSA